MRIAVVIKCAFKMKLLALFLTLVFTLAQAAQAVDVALNESNRQAFISAANRGVKIYDQFQRYFQGNGVVKSFYDKLREPFLELLKMVNDKSVKFLDFDEYLECASQFNGFINNVQNNFEFMKYFKPEELKDFFASNPIDLFETDQIKFLSKATAPLKKANSVHPASPQSRSSVSNAPVPISGLLSNMKLDQSSDASLNSSVSQNDRRLSAARYRDRTGTGIVYQHDDNPTLPPPQPSNRVPSQMAKQGSIISSRPSTQYSHEGSISRSFLGNQTASAVSGGWLAAQTDSRAQLSSPGTGSQFAPNAFPPQSQGTFQHRGSVGAVSNKWLAAEPRSGFSDPRPLAGAQRSNASKTLQPQSHGNSQHRSSVDPTFLQINGNSGFRRNSQADSFSTYNQYSEFAAGRMSNTSAPVSGTPMSIPIHLLTGKAGLTNSPGDRRNERQATTKPNFPALDSRQQLNSRPNKRVQYK